MIIYRLEENPIIYPKMFGTIKKYTQGKNINGPTLIKVPKWVKNPLGKYYLYFGHHNGSYIRLAYSNYIKGPYTLHKSGVLKTKDYPFLKYNHIASPEIFINQENQIIRMYYHANIRGKGQYKDQSQMTFLAFSKDGLNFETKKQQIAPFYLRVFKYNNFFYGIAKNDNLDGILLRSKDGLSEFERGPQFELGFRHCGLYLKKDILYVFFSRAFDKPEVLLLSQMNLTGDWTQWTLTKPKIILKPEYDWEGVNLPITKSTYGGTKPSHALRDPHIYKDNDELYLLYSVKGENGIAIAEIYDFE